MAVDRTGLRHLGFIFGGVTVAVMTMAFAVVLQHVEGRYALDTPPAITVTMR